MRMTTLRLLVAVAILAVLSSLALGQQTLTVPDDYPTIQAAIDAASPGDTVYVGAGMYQENIILDKPLQLVGAQRTVVRVVSDDPGSPTLSVALDEGEVSIEGIAVSRGELGVRVEVSLEATARLADVLILENKTGIVVAGGGMVSIDRCSLVDNELGVLLTGARTELLESEISRGSVGVLLAGSASLVMTRCLVGLSQYAIDTYTVHCGWPHGTQRFAGTVSGEANRVFGPSAGLCPAYPGEPWPERFVDEEWRQAIGQMEAAYNQGLKAYEEQKFLDAMAAFEVCLTVINQHPFPLLQSMLNQNIGVVYQKIGQYEDALEMYGAARAVYEERGLEVEVAGIDQNIGVIYRHTGRYEVALQKYRAAREVYEAEGLNVRIAEIEANIGVVYDDLGRYEDALESYQAAREGFSSLELEVAVAEVEANEGVVYWALGRYNDALEKYRAARDVYEALEVELGMAVVDQNIGLVYQELGQYWDALEKLWEARGVYEALGMKVDVAMVDQNIGVVYWLTRRYKEALERYRVARDVYDQYGGMRFKVAEIDQNIGSVYLELGRYEDALEAYEGALEILDEIPPLPGMRYSYPSQRWMIYSNQGIAYEALERFDDAVSAYKQAMDVVESIRGHLKAEDLKLAWGERTSHVYEHLIDLLHRMDRGSEAFPYAERSRARTFLDILYGGGVEPEQLISAEAGVSAGVVDPVAIDAAVGEALAYLEPGEAVLSYFVTDRGVYLWVITEGRIREPVFLPYPREELLADVAALRRAVEPKVVEDAEGAPRLRWGEPAELLGTLYGQLVQPGLAALAAEGLLEEVTTLVFIPSGPLWYVPFAALGMTDQPPVALDHLITRERHLVEMYTVAYLPSLASLPSLLESAGVGEGMYIGLADPELTPEQRERLGMVDPYYDKLRDAAKAFALCYTGAPAGIHVGAGATESRAHGEAPGHRVVMYAAHGQFNPYVPLQSQLYLAPGGERRGPHEEGRRIADGDYRAWEVLLTDHRGVELAILAACESLLPAMRYLQGAIETVSGQERDTVELTPEQLERIVVGDEVVGMARAFLSSGAHSVLGTQWLANPQAIEELLGTTCFHHQEAGYSWAEALREAQIAFIDRAAFSHPWFWASFQLIGRWR